MVTSRQAALKNLYKDRNNLKTNITFINYGDFQIRPEVVRHPHFEVPYPQLKRGQQSLGALVAVVRPFRYIYCFFLNTPFEYTEDPKSGPAFR